MTLDEFPAAPSGRPVWLITLADLALLMVGFFVLLQANHALDAKALAQGFRDGFGSQASAETPPIPVAAVSMLAFAPGSAALPSSADGVVAWAREAVRDPRVTLTVTGTVDGTPADVDPATRSGAVLAADRARAVAAHLAAVAPGRMTIVNAAPRGVGHRQVVVTLGFAGDPIRTKP